MKFSVEWSIGELDIENFEPGDVVLHNDPYRGGTHITDFTIIKPVFHKGELVAFSTNRAHQADVGGSTPGGFKGDATEIFQEGIRIPPVKVWERGKERDDIWKILFSNVRTPRNTKGDMRAQIASCVIGERRVLEIIEKYGLETYKQALEDIKDYSERRMRAEIKKIPDGVYESYDWLDDDGVDPKPIKLHVKITVKGSDAIFDYHGTDKQAKGPINAVYAVTAGQTYNALLHLTDPYIPMNQGVYRPVELVIPPGTVLNCNYPAPVFGGNTDTSNRVIEIVFSALSPVLKELSMAATLGTSLNYTFGGIDPRTRSIFVEYLWGEGGYGGRSFADGNSGLQAPDGNCKNQSVEVFETKFPLLVRGYGLTNRSAGAGKYRGGWGTFRIIEIQADDVVFSGIGERCTIPPYGLFGGKPGGKSSYLIRRKGEKEWKTPLDYGANSPSKFSGIRLNTGDIVCLVGAAGGGWGDPLEREPQAVLKDVEEEFIDAEAARRDYGVIESQPSKIDRDTTRSMREKVRRERRESKYIDFEEEKWGTMTKEEISKLGLPV